MSIPCQDNTTAFNSQRLTRYAPTLCNYDSFHSIAFSIHCTMHSLCSVPSCVCVCVRVRACVRNQQEHLHIVGGVRLRPLPPGHSHNGEEEHGHQVDQPLPPGGGHQVQIEHAQTEDVQGKGQQQQVGHEAPLMFLVLPPALCLADQLLQYTHTKGACVLFNHPPPLVHKHHVIVHLNSPHSP